MIERTVYSSRNLLVRAVTGRNMSVCAITFGAFADVPGLHQEGFGEAFFRSREIDAVHVVGRDNDWYQYPELKEALDAIRAATGGYGLTFTYGSSMGAYAALRFGGAVGADYAVAISPQHSLDPRKVPFENRWAEHSRRIRFIHDDDASLPPVRKAFVFFDPHDLDRCHVDLISAGTDVRAVRLPYGGHPAGAYLAEAGLLEPALLALAAGVFDPGEVERRARAGRRRSGQYLFTLARQLPLRRIGWKLAIARMAVAACPKDPVYVGFLARVLDDAGLVREAEERHREAGSSAVGTAIFRERWALFLLHHGRPGEAADLFATSRPPEAANRASLRAEFVALVASGRLSRAAGVAAAIRARFPKDLPRLARDLGRIGLWHLMTRLPVVRSAVRWRPTLIEKPPERPGRRPGAATARAGGRRRAGGGP